MINAEKQTCQPLTRILIFVSCSELSNLEHLIQAQSGHCVAIFLYTPTITRLGLRAKKTVGKPRCCLSDTLFFLHDLTVSLPQVTEINVVFVSRSQ